RVVAAAGYDVSIESDGDVARGARHAADGARHLLDRAAGPGPHRRQAGRWGQGFLDELELRVHSWQHGAQQAFMVDGMDITSYSGGISFTMDSFAYQEINYQGGNLPAERAAAGVVSNMITKTGTTRFRGSAAING